jgi:hypothetical protein
LAEERVAEIEFRGGTQKRVIGQHGARKKFGRRTVILQPVSRRASIELQPRGIGLHAQSLFKLLPGLLVVSGIVQVKAGRPPGGSGKQPEGRHGQGAATTLADQALEAEQRDGGTQRPLVTFDRTA